MSSVERLAIPSASCKVPSGTQNASATGPRNLRDAEDALAKIAGLWWPRSASGDFEAEDRRMAKTGNRYLRYYLIQAAYHMRKQIAEYAAYYARKFKEASKHHHKRDLVMTARKSVGLVVGLLHLNEPYRSKGA